MSEEKSGGLRGILITAGFTLLGGIIGVLGKGYYDLAVQKEKSTSELQIEEKKINADIQLEREKFQSNTKIERQKLDEDLIKLALQSQETDKRTEALRFMVETGLIADSDIKQGVESYLDQKKPVPALAATFPINQQGVIPLQQGINPLRSDSGDFRFNGFRAEMEGDHPAMWALLSSAAMSHEESGGVVFTFPPGNKAAFERLKQHGAEQDALDSACRHVRLNLYLRCGQEQVFFDGYSMENHPPAFTKKPPPQ